MYDFKNKVALVTGAGGKLGMGHAICVRLAKEGADIVACGHHLPPEGLSEQDRLEGWRGVESVVEEVKSFGRDAIAVKADVSDSRQVQDMAAAAFKKFGKVDILVNNAGMIEYDHTSVVDKDEKIFERLLSVNVTGTFLCTKYIAKNMVERREGGKIINISSNAGKYAPRKGMAGYIASKFAVVGFTQATALDLAEYKINVNCLCMNSVITELMTGKGLREEAHRLGESLEETIKRRYSHVEAKVPLGRPGTVEDIAAAVCFFASAESEYMTGLAITMTGGEIMF
jgi:NAD(P)-dependent dehydrogenase (short-subunit alcohol dehydrogenase family)